MRIQSPAKPAGISLGDIEGNKGPAGTCGQPFSILELSRRRKAIQRSER